MKTVTLSHEQIDTIVEELRNVVAAEKDFLYSESGYEADPEERDELLEHVRHCEEIIGVLTSPL